MSSEQTPVCSFLCDRHLYVAACSYELLHLWVQGGDHVLRDVLGIKNDKRLVYFSCGFSLCLEPTEITLKSALLTLVFSTTLERKVPPLTQEKRPGEGGESAMATATWWGGG